MSKSQRAPRTVLEYLIQQRDNTYEELAREFSRLDDHAAISARHLGRLARGERDMAGTTPATRRALQAMFGLTADELLRPWSAGELVSTCQPMDGAVLPPSTGDEGSLLAMAAERARRFTRLASEGITPDVIDQSWSGFREPDRPTRHRPGQAEQTAAGAASVSRFGYGHRVVAARRCAAFPPGDRDDAKVTSRISIDHRIMGGVPCVAGTRIPVATVIGLLG